MSRTIRNTLWRPDYQTRKALREGKAKLKALCDSKRYAYAMLAIAAAG